MATKDAGLQIIDQASIGDDPISLDQPPGRLRGQSPYFRSFFNPATSMWHEERKVER